MRIAFISEETSKMTGGRYFCYFVASALVELGHDVTYYTNRRADFESYFKDYKKPAIRVVAKRPKDLENINVKADVYIGSPIHGDIAAAKLGKRYNKKAFAIIFDPIPMIEKFKGIKIGNKDWVRLVEIISQTDTKIISLCNATKPYIYDWLNKTDRDIFPVYPCINSKEKAKIENIPEENYALFISRIVRHKNFDHAVWACKKNRINLKVISSIDGMNSPLVVRRFGMKSRTEFLFNVDEKRKFELIKGAKVLLWPSTFEGWGIPVTEFIASGVPIVAYEYPTTKEIEGYSKTDLIYWAKFNNLGDFSAKLKKALREKKTTEESSLFDFEVMIERLKEVING